MASIVNISGRAIVYAGRIIENGETLEESDIDEARGEEIVAASQRFEAASFDAITAMIDLVKLGGISKTEARERAARLYERMTLFTRAAR